jgi:hypothetical protein
LGIGWFIAGASITVALGATATWAALDTEQKSSEYRDNPTRDRFNEGKDLETRRNLLFGATGFAALGTTLIVILTDWSGGTAEGPEEHGVQVHPMVAAEGSMLLLSGNF